MGKPVIVVVDDEDSMLNDLAAELNSRYGTHYQVVSSSSAEDALTHLRNFKAAGDQVPLVLADQWMPAGTGIEFLTRVRELNPTARRGLLISWADRSTATSIVEAASSGQVDFLINKPVWSPDEQFHMAVTEALENWWRLQGGRFESVTVIGAEFSARAHEIRDLLTRNNIPFGFQVDDSPEGRAVLKSLGAENAGGPVVALYTGVVLIDPTNAEVAEALGVGVHPTEQTYDVVIVGAGPAGLAAAVYAASEGLSAALVEHQAFGGQAGTSSLIRNYLGFPRGVSGVELAGRAYEQAWLFGTHFIYGNPASALQAEGPLRCVTLGDGSEVRGRAIVIATGMSYRRLGIADLETLVGAGVFYGAATVEAKGMTGRPAFVVGGGNSAGQAALHLAKFAETVTILVRGESLAASMSEYLVREIKASPKVEVRHRVEVVGGSGAGRLEYLKLHHMSSGEIRSVPAAGLFILIGGEPFTQWLPHSIIRDQWGFIVTGSDLAAGTQQAHAPLLFESSTPGVFAIGDARSGSVKRVASAVGEGAIAIRQVHEYLARVGQQG